MDGGRAGFRGGRRQRAEEQNVRAAARPRLAIPLPDIAVAKVVDEIVCDLPDIADAEALAVVADDIGRRLPGEPHRLVGGVILQVAAEEKLVMGHRVPVQPHNRGVQVLGVRRGKTVRPDVQPVAKCRSVGRRVEAQEGENIWIDSRPPRAGAVGCAVGVRGRDVGRRLRHIHSAAGVDNIARLERIGRHLPLYLGIFPNVRRLIIAKEEQLVLLDRAAYIDSIGVADIFARKIGQAAGGFRVFVEEVVGGGGGVAVVLVHAAVELVGPALGD